MKHKISTAFLISIISLSATAQQTPSMVRTTDRTTFGVHAGVNMFNITGKGFTGVDLDGKVKTGFTAGVNAEIPLGSGAYIQPGVDFQQKGMEGQDGSKTTLNYIDVPVNFIYKPILGTGNFVLGVGPYIGFGISGKFKSPNGAEQDINFGDKDDNDPAALHLARTDAGANFLVGYEFANKLSLNLKAQLGLKKINPDIAGLSDEASFKNTGFGLSIGYRF